VIQVNAGSLSVVAAGFTAIGVTMDRARVMVLGAAGRRLHTEIRESLSIRDHTLTDLEGLDHPYAKRHGRVLTGRLGHAGPLAGVLVHRQSNDMRRALQSAFTPSKRGYRVWVNLTVAPYARWVIQGTKTMFGRDVLWETAIDRQVRANLMREVVRVLGKELRSQGVVRFGSSSRSPLSGTGIP